MQRWQGTALHSSRRRGHLVRAATRPGPRSAASGHRCRRDRPDRGGRARWRWSPTFASERGYRVDGEGEVLPGAGQRCPPASSVSVSFRMRGADDLLRRSGSSLTKAFAVHVAGRAAASRRPGAPRGTWCATIRCVVTNSPSGQRSRSSTSTWPLPSCDHARGPRLRHPGTVDLAEDERLQGIGRLPAA